MPSKWLTWSPKTASSQAVAPTEPTKPACVGFVGASTGTLQKIEEVPRCFRIAQCA